MLAGRKEKDIPAEPLIIFSKHYVMMLREFSSSPLPPLLCFIVIFDTFVLRPPRLCSQELVWRQLLFTAQLHGKSCCQGEGVRLGVFHSIPL